MSQMIEVKTAELIGPALDWAVAMCEGERVVFYRVNCVDPLPYVMKTKDGKSGFGFYRPSSDWSQGGPLISKYLLDFCVEHEDVICSVLCDENGMQVSEYRYGETHLIAACRAIVAAKLGDVIQVPAGLVGGEE